MSEETVFEGLTKLALEDLQNVPQDEIGEISFCCFMTATRKDGSALGGAFIVDSNIGDISSEELVKFGSLPSLTSYIIMRQSQPIVNRCISAAVTLQAMDTEEKVVVNSIADLEGEKH